MANEADARQQGGVERHPGYSLVDAVAAMRGRPHDEIQHSEQVLRPFARRTAVTIVPGTDAQELVLRLEQSGVEGGRISFLRLDEPSTSDHVDATPSPSLDVGQAQRLGGGLPKGVAIGAVCGAVLAGLLVWLVADGEAAIWGAIGGAALGGALGGLWALFLRVGASTAFERTMHLDPTHEAAIGVHADDDEGLADARDAFEGYRVWVFDSDGNVLERD